VVVTKENLQVRKQELVRNAIFDAAIEIFAAKGFDETTVEEVAQAAGVSRRSFFRYFASKDDLLAQNVVHYGVALNEAITACPQTFTSLEIVRETVLSVGKQSVAHPHTRRVIEIAERSASARQAHLSRWIEVEDSVAKAFAGRLRSASKDDLRPRLLASLTLSVMNVAIIAWFRGEYQDFSTAAKHVFSNLTRIFSDQTSSSHSRTGAATGREPAGTSGRRRSGKVKQ
jgi:AcrR family transcriptional regulator